MAIDKREILTKEEVKKQLCAAIKYDILRQPLFIALTAFFLLPFVFLGRFVRVVFYWVPLLFLLVHLIRLVIKYHKIKTLQFSFVEDTFVGVSDRNFKMFLYYYFIYGVYTILYLGKMKLISFSAYGTTDRNKSSISFANYGDPYILVLLNNKKKSVIDYYSATLFRLEKTNS